MQIWLVTIGEPLPTDSDNERLMRAGILAETFVAHGHEVLWWTSTFDHVKKLQRFDTDTAVTLRDGYRMRLLHSVPYQRNVSFSRIVNHRGLARKFAQLAETEQAPDLVLSSWPPIELCWAVTDYGLRHGVPTVLDVRDLWPDYFLDLAPGWARPAARLALAPVFRATRVACRQATALTGLTDAYLEWALRYASRTRSPLDGVFPMGYTAQRPTDEALAKADAFWKERGIGGDRSEFVACYFGYMGRQFELETVIDAARLLHRDCRFRFVLCGSGDRFARYQRMAANCTNVLLAGWVAKSEIWSLMRLSAVGLAPYKSTSNFVGNLPNKPIEYFSAGLPVVSSLKGVLQKLLVDNDCGVTYENGNAAALARVLTDLYDDRGRLAAMAANANRLYEREFVAEKVYGDMVRHLESVVHMTNASVHAAPAGSR